MNRLHDISEREIRGLWLREPFATLTAFHGKVETRSWKTNYRGLVLICSSLKAYEPARLRAMCGQELAHEIRTLVRPDMRPLGAMPAGGVAVCLAELVEVRRLQEDDAHFINWNGSLYWQEQAYAWVFENVVPVQAFPIKGQLGMPRLSMEIKERICAK